MRKVIVWFFGLLLLFFVLMAVAVLMAPANLLLRVSELWAPQVKMAEPTGTIWEGEASNVVVSVNDTQLELGQLSWSISPWSVLSANPTIELNVESPEHHATARVSATSDLVITIDQMEGAFPLSLLEPWVPLLVQGDLAFVVDHVVFSLQQERFVFEELLGLDGALNLQQADWLGGDVEMPLGSYIAQLSLDDNKDIFIQVNDFSATLGIDGSIVISPKGTYQFNSVLQTRDGLAPEVAQSVQWFGKKNANGDIVVNNTGRWN
jgi:Type II secretion system (T2SS), protein N